MSAAEAFHYLMFVVALVCVVTLVWRWRLYGFLGAVVAVWVLGMLRMQGLMMLEATYVPGTGGAAWMAGGGLVTGLIVATPFYALRLLWDWLQARKAGH